MDFTKNNTALAPLFTAKFPSDTYLLANKKLYRELRIQASTMYEALFGSPMDMEEDFTLVLKCKDGELQKIYGPSVGKDPNSNAFAIKWGEKYVVLDDKLKGPELPEGSKWDTFGLSMANFGYKDDEIALIVMLETEDGFFDVKLPLRFQDARTAPDLAGLKTLLKKDPATAYGLFYEVFEGAPGDGGGGIQKLQDLEEGTVLQLTGSEVYEFKTKKGEERRSVLLIDEKGTKYWSPDNVQYVVGNMTNPTIEILKLAKGKKSNYIAHGKIYDDNSIMEFGSLVKAKKEKEIPAGDYKVFGVDSFQGRNTNFISYVYTMKLDAELGGDDRLEYFTCFAPSKHRVVLNSVPDITPETPGTFTVFVSGIEDEKKFQVGQLEAEFSMGDEAIDVDNLF